MALGTTIQKKRSERGLSQEQLAELVGVSRQAVSKWEVGDAIPDTDKLIPLARALGISVDELLGNVVEEPVAAQESVPRQPNRQPGWFATHWYWLGMIPVIWGAWQLLWLIVMLVSALLYTGEVASFGGGLQITTSGGAIPIV